MTSVGGDDCNATLLVETRPNDRQQLSQLRADSSIEFIDRWHEQRDELRRLRPPVAPDVVAEPKTWAYYPWRRTVAGILGPRGFRAVRLDRNRNLITAGEQQRLGSLRIGIVGLSVGQAIAYALSQEGLCGLLRLADFDDLELSNLNRVPSTVFDHGLNKAIVAARRVAELDPYQAVEVFNRGVTPDSVDRFLDGLDILVEECDSLDTKLLVRQAARLRGIPVLMATGDGGLLDVERFDLEPQRPLLHGLLGEIDIAELAGLPSEDKVPFALRMMDGARLSPRMAASLVEVGNSLGTWPQLAGEVTLGATLVAEAVRRIGLGEDLPSGRVRTDVARALRDIEEPALAEPQADGALETGTDPAPLGAIETVIAAAVRAPSGGNAQPWHISTRGGSIIIALAPEHTSPMDVGYRASAVAVGAAAFNARVAAAANGILGPVSFELGDDGTPLRAVVQIGDRSDTALATLYDAMLARETNRHHGKPPSLTAELVESMHTAARREGARLHLVTTGPDVEKAAAILAESDRIRYLTPRLHAQMVSEVRWPGDEAQDSGIDVHSLELPAADLVKLDVLRRPEVMAYLAAWDAGSSLGADTRERILASSCVAVVAMNGHQLTDYARAGSAVEAVWVLAQQSGLAVQPISPVFLYAHDTDDLESLSPTHTHALQRLRDEFRELTATTADEAHALVLRLADAPATSVRSRRRAIVTSTLMA